MTHVGFLLGRLVLGETYKIGKEEKDLAETTEEYA